MNKQLLARICVSCALLGLSAVPVIGEEFGPFTYRVVGDTVEITRSTFEIEGEVQIPAEIEGKPVTAIGPEVFTFRTRLTRVTIPASVTSLGDHPFYGCGSLTSIEVEPGNTQYASHEGVLYNSDMTWLIRCPQQMAGAFTIPQGVTSIGLLNPECLRSFISCAAGFSGCSRLTSITIPDGVTHIGHTAFERCSGLTEITVPEGVTKILHSTFQGCSGLTSITLPASADWISPEACGAGCTELTSIHVKPGSLHYASHEGVLYRADLTELVRFPAGKAEAYVIPDGTISIDDLAFYYSRKLTSLAIPSSVSSIDSGFQGCTEFASIHVKPGSRHYASHDGVLYNARLTELILCPQGKAGVCVVPKDTWSIGRRGFVGCSQLTSIHVEPGSLHYASHEGVLYNADLTELVRFPEGKVGAYVIPEGTTSVGSPGFHGCSQLTSLTISKSVSSIDTSFYGCSMLSPVTFLGDAPERWEPTSGGNFIIQYLGGSAGFTSPAWGGYGTMVIDETTYPAASWLLQQGLTHDLDVHQDASVLLAYALNLDPARKGSINLPRPALGDAGLSLTFYAGRPEITYSVETSTDLQEWTTDGVTLSDLGPDSKITASISPNSSANFMRLVVGTGG